MSNNRVKDADQPWCVYTHYHENDLVYIGSGTLQRCMDFSKDKRSEEHYSWFCSRIVEEDTSFVKILKITEDYNEARFIEGRLIAEFKPMFNRNLNKLTFIDIDYAQKQLALGKSLRVVAAELDIYHNNLGQMLKLPYCMIDYSSVSDRLKEGLI